MCIHTRTCTHLHHTHTITPTNTPCRAHPPYPASPLGWTPPGQLVVLSASAITTCCPDLSALGLLQNHPHYLPQRCDILPKSYSWSDGLGHTKVTILFFFHVAKEKSEWVNDEEKVARDSRCVDSMGTKKLVCSWCGQKIITHHHKETTLGCSYYVVLYTAHLPFPAVHAPPWCGWKLLPTTTRQLHEAVQYNAVLL